MADWQSFVVQVPGKDLLEPVRNVLETLLVFLDVLQAILDTVKVFLVDFGNPIQALVEALIKLIQELFLSLKTSGVSAYFDIPDPSTDPNFDRVAGGFPAFVERFKASLFDPLDFNRPQPRAGSTQSGFVILMVDSPNVFTLINRVKQLLRFFGREFTTPRYEAPINFRVIPVGAKGDPIFAVASVFTEGPIEAVQLLWTLPTSMATPDPGFTDAVTKVAAEFVPPSFLIERSEINPASQKVSLSDLGSADSAGTVEYLQETSVSIGDVSQKATVKLTLIDEYGDPVIKFQKYTVLSQTDVTSLLGQLGTFRYVDTEVEADKTYFYRIRAFSGELKIQDGSLDFPTTTDDLTFTTESQAKQMQWPSANAGESVVMGKASGLVSAIIPVPMDPAVFDVIEVLKGLLQVAFSLDFQLQLDPSATFDSSGYPTGATSPTEVGRGALTNLASSLASFESFTILSYLTSKDTLNESFQPDPITGKYPELPWQNYGLRKQTSRLTDSLASAMLQAGSYALEGFRTIMQSSFPVGPIDTAVSYKFPDGTVVQASTLEQLVIGFTPTEVTSSTAATFNAGYSDASLRLNVLVAVQYVKNFAMGGAPVDWIAVVPLRDIVPWSGQMIYDLLDKVQALLAGFQGVISEVKAFIDILERKIAALERFVEFLINILNFIEGLQIGAYVLAVPQLSGSASSWVQAVDSAGGSKPTSGPGGYSAGVAFGYVAPDVTAFKTAFSIIFGG